MKIEILEIAHLEFRTAKDYYEIEQKGLGARFESEIKQAMLRIQQYPKAWSSERKEIRRYFVHKFPYKTFTQSKKRSLLYLRSLIYIENQIIGLIE